MEDNWGQRVKPREYVFDGKGGVRKRVVTEEMLAMDSDDEEMASLADEIERNYGDNGTTEDMEHDGPLEEQLQLHPEDLSLIHI